ncbi:PIG-L family deacetylase [bacterium]|nr:MAG: PIG-L family deacetylase [bacterium]
MSSRLIVISAHAGDWLWRAGGAIGKVVQGGGEAAVVALSYGERGESGELWKQPAQTVDNVKKIREQEVRSAAAILGAAIHFFDLGDYPLVVDRPALDRLTELMRDFEPDTVITHTELDPANPDHPEAHRAAVLARKLAIGAGVPAAFKTIAPPALYVFEPHHTELCSFSPDTYLDITDVFPRKAEAMARMAAQQYMIDHYTQRAQNRASFGRRFGKNQTMRYAEAFQRLIPEVVDTL